VLLSPREDDNIPIQDGYAPVIGLNIIYDGGQSSERAWIISPDQHPLSDLEPWFPCRVSQIVILLCHRLWRHQTHVGCLELILK
jgi:hypothetical protein